MITDQIHRESGEVTILVLVENSLQYYEEFLAKMQNSRHNPCFSGKLFAIKIMFDYINRCQRHNPCFSGKLFAIHEGILNWNSIV